MCPPTKANAAAWLPIILAFGGIIAWGAQTNNKVERLETDMAAVANALPEIQESLTRIETVLEIRRTE